MEYSEIITIISNYAFPIAMCIIVFIQNNTTLKKLTELMSTINTRLEYIEKLLQIKGDYYE